MRASAVAGEPPSPGDVTAVVAARHVASGHADARRGSDCRNCGALAPGNFCATCGQATVLHPPTVLEFVHEFVGHYIAVDGPLLRTLHALVVTPGRLTADYFAGRRQRYVAPLRLYLTISVVLFAVSGLTGGLRIGGGERGALEFRFDDPPSTAVAPDPTDAVDSSGPRIAMPATGWLHRSAQRIADLSPEQRMERVRGSARQYLPYVLLVLVPLLAWLLKLAYWQRHLFFGEHLVVAFHAQTVAFLFALASSIPVGSWWGDCVVVVLIVHGAIALRRVYGGRWWATVARELFVLGVYAMLVGLSAAALATLSLLA